MRRKMRLCGECEDKVHVKSTVKLWKVGGVARFNKGLACGFSSEATIPTKQLQ